VVVSLVSLACAITLLRPRRATAAPAPAPAQPELQPLVEKVA
jgi:hypothetical protein